MIFCSVVQVCHYLVYCVNWQLPDRIGTGVWLFYRVEGYFYLGLDNIKRMPAQKEPATLTSRALFHCVRLRRDVMHAASCDAPCRDVTY